MAVLINGVLALREAGFLMPTTELNSIVIEDCIINCLRVDNGHNSKRNNTTGQVIETEIRPTPDNLPLLLTKDNWSLNTEFFATFNGDLEAGPLTFYGNEVDAIMVRRTSNKSYYTEWEDVKLIEKQKRVVWGGDEDIWELPENFSFEDKAIESGIWYKYAIQPISKDKRGTLYQGANRAIIYEDIYLVGENGRQLRIRYNPNISSFRRNIRETKTETIGSKHPFITRNAHVGYIEFPLGGTITHFMDSDERFAPRSEMFVEDEFLGMNGAFDLSQSYDKLYDHYDLTDYTNPVLERGFRQRVMDFLMDGKPKLLKSPTEGNFIVRLMDVNFTPNPQLGRMIYDFTCNAIEVDEVNLYNLEKYKIQER